MDIKNNLKSFGADKMTSKERFARMYEHRDADRVPIMDYPWGVTVDRWVAEGMPDRDFVKYFGLDNVATIHADFSPRYEFKVLEDTPEYTVYTTNWGATMKNWKHIASTPDFLDFKVKDRDSWADAKARMKPGRDRVNWKELEKNYPIWQKEGYWIVGGMWFGFDVAHSWMIGTERFLMALIDDPEWCVDIINTYLDINLAMMDMVWDAGYRFDEINWPDDMGYKGTQFFSLSMYRELIKPAQKRAVEWAQKKGIKTRLHSCGKIDVFIPDFIEMGLDALNPIEVKAGNDPLAIKKQYGDKLLLHGGVNAVLWDDTEAITEEIKRVLPGLKENGGYIFGSDHSIPSAVSLENFRHIIDTVKKYGGY